MATCAKRATFVAQKRRREGARPNDPGNPHLKQAGGFGAWSFRLPLALPEKRRTETGAAGQVQTRPIGSDWATQDLAACRHFLFILPYCIQR